MTDTKVVKIIAAGIVTSLIPLTFITGYLAAIVYDHVPDVIGVLICVSCCILTFIINARMSYGIDKNTKKDDT